MYIPMKKYLSLFLLLSLSLSLSAQSRPPHLQSKCKDIYVWDFLDQEKNQNRNTRDITEAAEEALTNIDECFVLQRRNLATLLNHAAAEKGINSVKEMRYEITHALSGGGAKLVMFGTVDMSARDACEVKLRIEDLATSRIVTSKSTRVLNSELSNIDTRNIVISRLVHQLLGKPYAEPQLRKNTIMPVQSMENVGKKKNYTISAKSGIDLIMGECTGDAYNQTVTVNFTFTNNSPNMALALLSEPAFASDMDGNQYPLETTSLGGSPKVKTYSLEREFYTGTKLKASVTFRNILPGVKTLAVVKISYHKRSIGLYDYFSGDITFRDLNINWR